MCDYKLMFSVRMSPDGTGRPLQTSLQRLMCPLYFQYLRILAVDPVLRSESLSSLQWHKSFQNEQQVCVSANTTMFES